MAVTHSCKGSTTKPIFRDLSQFDDLQAVVFQFEVVVTFKEVAVICERQTQISDVFRGRADQIDPCRREG